MSDLGVKIVIGICASICLLILWLIGAVFYAGYKHSKSPTFELHKSEWSCTETTTRTVTTNILVGKVIVPQTQVTTICLNYKRI